MSYTETPNLKLKKDDGNEKIANWRPHSNSNMDTLDQAVQNLVEVCANAKSLLGQLGLDESGNPLINAASARNTLGAATSGGASKTLYAAEQSIATNAGNISKNATNISKNATDIQTLRDSVSHGKLKAANVSGTTEANGIFQLTDFKLGQRVVVGVISDDWYTAIPFAVGGWQNWMLQVFTLDHDKKGGQQVSFSILYYDS